MAESTIERDNQNIEPTSQERSERNYDSQWSQSVLRERMQTLREQSAEQRTERARMDLSMCPERIQGLIQKKLLNDQQDGIYNQDTLWKREEEYIYELKNIQCTQRGDALYVNKEGIKQRIRDLAVEAFLNNDESQLQRYARVAIDINGLKAINDIAGHEKGDRLIEEVARTLKSMEQEMKEQFKVGVELSVEGGDEFGFLIESSHIISVTESLAIRDAIQKQLASIDTSFLDDAEKSFRERAIDRGARLDDDYQFEITGAVGVTRFDRALTSDDGFERVVKALEVKQKKFGTETNFNDFKDVLMGEIMDNSDKLMAYDKEIVKEQMDPQTQELLLRNDAMVALEREKQELEKKRDELMSELGKCETSLQTLGAQLKQS